jgi:hypothetical protein
MGREFQIIHAGQSTAKVRVFVTNKGLYQLVVSSTTAADLEVGVFLNAFWILDQ